MGKRGVLSAFLILGVLGLLLAEAGPAAGIGIRARRVVRCRASLPFCVPTAFAFGPDGRRLFYTQKDTGQIRVRNLRTRRDVTWTTIQDLATTDTQGLLGLALDPSWARGPEHRWVYVYYTDEGPEDEGVPGEETPDQNVIVRIRKDGFTRITEVLLEIPTMSVADNGGPLRFGPDGKLYAFAGYGTTPSRAQDLADPGGKVLRMNRNGSAPSDNPFAAQPGTASLVYSFGNRNSFGFTFDPWTGRLWETENGPECNDEINVVLPGGNYAWGPSQACGSLPTPHDTNQDGPAPRILPKHTFVETVTPTGAAFCRRCRLGRRAGGDLLVASYKRHRIWAFDLNASRTDLTDRRTVYRGDLGPIAVQVGPDRRIYFSDPTGIFVLTRPNPRTSTSKTPTHG